MIIDLSINRLTVDDHKNIYELKALKASNQNWQSS